MYIYTPLYNNSLYTQWYLMTLGKNDSKITKPLSVIKKRTLLTNICKFSFDNRTIEKIFLVFFMVH